MKYGFEKLEVWNKSRALVVAIYKIIQQFPSEEKFGLTSQIRRAAVSVSSNLAEGSTRQSAKEKARFYEISYGSLIEILNQAILAKDLKFMTEKELEELRMEIEPISRMINALHKNSKG